MTDPILIVGAGPTGLTAALELTRLGIAVRLIDKRGGPDSTSRAIGVQARTLELLEQRGLADEMVRLGNKGAFGSIYGGGKRVFRIDFARVESRYPYILFISQAETERILREALAKYGIAPEWRTELIGIQQNALSHETSPVHAVLRHADGEMEALAMPWLIGAEGAHSLVRTTLDLPYEGHTRDEHYALGDLFIDGGLVDTDFHIFSSDHGFMALFPMGGKHFRLIVSHPLTPALSGAAPTLDEFQRIYDQRSPIPARFHDLVWSTLFRINSRMVSRLKVGRLLIGGDAAHIHSPAGAQGMNTGMQDMINLCWKLALVMQGKATPTLLDTYEADRLPVMRGVLSRTDRLTTVIDTENPVVRTLFNHIGPFIGGADRVQENATATMSQVALDYRGSTLSEHHAHGGSLHAGDRMPEIDVRDITSGNAAPARLLSLLDPSRFTLLLATPEDTAHTDALQRVSPMARVIPIAPVPEAAARQRFEQIFGRNGSVTLVRPDGYAAMTSPLDGAAERVRAYVGKWLVGG